MWARLVSVAIGLWLMAAPTVLGYAGTAATNDRVVGPLVAGFAFVAVWAHMRPLRWANAVLGFWLVAAPIVLGYPTVPAANSTVAGLAVVVVSLVRGSVEGEFGGGWSSLLTGDFELEPRGDERR